MHKYNNKKRDNVTPIEKENERDETYTPDNPQIDLLETHNNYHTVYPESGYMDYINKRIATLPLKRKVRNDAVLMCSFIIGSDNGFMLGLTPSEQRKFFEDCTDYFAERYGRENIISAVVHVDETTPHLHVNFVPINDGRLSSKSLFDRQKLAELQTELWEQVGKKYGLQRGKENSQATHVTAAEHKAKVIVQSAEQKRDEIDRQTEQKQAELDGLTQTVEAVTQATGKPIPKKKKQASDEITALRARNAVLEEEIKWANKDRTDLFREYTREKRRADEYEKTVREVAEIKAVLPDGYTQLLQDVQDEKAERYEKERQQNLARIRGRNKDFYM